MYNRMIWLRETYGLTLKQYDEMLEQQNEVCAICGDINHNGRRLCVDHNHKTGKVRGLLCCKCNTHLGTYENRKEEFENYLERY